MSSKAATRDLRPEHLQKRRVNGAKFHDSVSEEHREVLQLALEGVINMLKIIAIDKVRTIPEEQTYMDVFWRYFSRRDE